MRALLFTIPALLPTSAATTPSPSLGDTHLTFEAYLASHGKSYASPAELASRRARFEQTRAFVIAHNAKYVAEKVTWWAAMNAFADQTDAELAAVGAKHFPTTTAALSPPLASGAHARPDVDISSVPVAKSWIGVQTPVRNQGGCGSCWAFGSSEVLESHLMIAENRTIADLILAPQDLVDCAPNPRKCGGTGGCEGATAEIAFNWTRSVGGIAAESDYKYTGTDGTCNVAAKKTVTCGGFTKLAVNSVAAMEQTLANVGPVAVVVASNWATYGGGIFADGCLSWLGSCTLDHVVVVVGYDQTSWLVRNSWGANWGEAGYIRLTRKNDNVTYTDDHPSEGNACAPFVEKQSVMGESGILFDASYPTDVVRL